MSPSAVLLAAADRVRDLAAAATDGPWAEQFDTPRTVAGRFSATVCEIKSPMADGRWIAALSPAIAPHLESILREAAAVCERAAAEGWTDEAIRADADPSMRSALALAAVLVPPVVD